MPNIAFSLSKITSKKTLENNLARLFLFLEVKIALRGYFLFFALKDALGRDWASFHRERNKTAVSQSQKAQRAKTIAVIWKATKEYLNQRGTKIRVFRVCFRTPFLPPLFPHFFPLFPLQALCILAPLLPSSPPPSRPLFWLPEKSDLGTPLI